MQQRGVQSSVPGAGHGTLWVLIHLGPGSKPSSSPLESEPSGTLAFLFIWQLTGLNENLLDKAA